MFEAMGVGFLDLKEAFALYHPCVLEKRLPSEMPMSVQEKFFRSGYMTMEEMAWVMCLIGYRKCVEDKDKIGVDIKGEVTYTKIYDAYSKYYGNWNRCGNITAFLLITKKTFGAGWMIYSNRFIVSAFRLRCGRWLCVGMPVDCLRQQ